MSIGARELVEGVQMSIGARSLLYQKLVEGVQMSIAERDVVGAHSRGELYRGECHGPGEHSRGEHYRGTLLVHIPGHPTSKGRPIAFRSTESL